MTTSHDHQHSPQQGGHSHGHTHSHTHASARRLMWALLVTLVILVAELVGAWWSQSLALAADAGHMAVDSTGLIVALIAARLMLRPRSDRYTWGWARSEVLAAALQAGMLIIISALVTWEAIWRLVQPESLDPKPMVIIGVIGLVANVISLLILSGGRHDSLNMKAAFLEVANDAFGSLAVVIAGLVAWVWGWQRIDAIASLLIVVLMVPRAVTLLRSAVQILLEATPSQLDLQALRQHILELPNVVSVHDLHVSTIQTGIYALTAHVGTNATSIEQQAQLLHNLEECARHHHNLKLSHTTFQLEPANHAEHEEINH
ncbi:cation transporter [Boudabousia liubingyangii]|uniref:cation diffusion facilitator family transporter n=1 Tax=Boudabousia liubingyangii TaxID=1921764 RepID=UPI00093F9E99|nr:cation diffusion facilitator family transporter [Boudabousia liubingyangii]OKL46895.1 cation transporter [Boudabousia liubingyangii]